MASFLKPSGSFRHITFSSGSSFSRYWLVSVTPCGSVSTAPTFPPTYRSAISPLTAPPSVKECRTAKSSTQKFCSALESAIAAELPIEQRS